ncbi:MAG: PKD domain-containing protein [Candidatus Micrarchaeia archaeon]|jgi:PKD repeat protein
MQKGFVNFAFALFAALMLAGSLFAESTAGGNTAVSSNKAPVITGTGGPSTLGVNQEGTWTVTAYDPDGTYLTYSVNWGESAPASSDAVGRIGSSATFEHTYASAGAYMITFTVKDAQGGSTQSAAYVNVGGYSSGCDSSFNHLSVGQMLQVPPMTNTYGVKLIDISADSDRAAMVQILDPNEAVLDYAKVVPGTKYVYSGKSGNLAIETCKATSASNDVNSAWIKGAMTTSPGTDVCAGYHTLTIGQEIDAKTFLVRLDGVYTAQGITASQRTAKVGILSPLDVLLEEKTMAPGSSYTYTQPGTSNSVTVKLCDTAYGAAAGTSWAKMDAIALSSSTGNLPPVITEVGGPTSLAVNTAGTWKVSAYDPDGSYINVGVDWGDGNKAPSPVSGSLLTFQHTYAQPGTYRVVFTVTDDKGAQAQSTVTVAVLSGITPASRISIKLERGWNMVSVPTSYEVTPDEIAKKCDISTTVWAYNPQTGQYTTATTLRYGMIGFWIRANSACTYELDAPYYSLPTYPMKAGWNMIGSPLISTAISSFAGDCRITSGPWNYSPSAEQYAYSSTLEPAKGYWVKVASDCTLKSASDVPPSAPTN